MSIRRRRISVAGAVLAATLSASSARAEDLEWEPAWQRAEPGHLLGASMTLGLTVGAMFLPQTEDAWTHGILFDEWASRNLTLGAREHRRTAVAIGDAFYWGLMVYPPVVDIGIATLAVHQSPDVAWQLFWMDMQAYAFAGLVSRVTQKLVGRHRPYVDRCDDEPDYDDGCADPTDRNQGFVSGHTALAFTGAMLMCTQHARHRLYANDAADALACSLSVAGATYVGYSRIVGDRHYASDVLAGAALGVVSGWLLPELLYYQFNGDSPGSSHVVVMPAVSRTATGIAVIGAL